VTGVLRDYHAPVWDEPIIMEMGAKGRRGQIYGAPEPEVTALVGDAADLLPVAMRRATPPALPELSEPEVQRHYLVGVKGVANLIPLQHGE
jgi:glycine dehydrogenase subunit 2